MVGMYLIEVEAQVHKTVKWDVHPESEHAPHRSDPAPANYVDLPTIYAEPPSISSSADLQLCGKWNSTVITSGLYISLC